MVIIYCTLIAVIVLQKERWDCKNDRSPSCGGTTSPSMFGPPGAAAFSSGLLKHQNHWYIYRLYRSTKQIKSQKKWKHVISQQKKSMSDGRLGHCWKISRLFFGYPPRKLKSEWSTRHLLNWCHGFVGSAEIIVDTGGKPIKWKDLAI